VVSLPILRPDEFNVAALPQLLDRYRSSQIFQNPRGMMMDEQKKKALAAAMGQIEKQFGKNAVMRMGDAPRAKIDVIPTGSLALDAALGIGGLPRGRIVEIYYLRTRVVG